MKSKFSLSNMQPRLKSYIISMWSILFSEKLNICILVNSEGFKLKYYNELINCVISFICKSFTNTRKEKAYLGRLRYLLLWSCESIYIELTPFANKIEKFYSKTPRWFRIIFMIKTYVAFYTKGSNFQKKS